MAEATELPKAENRPAPIKRAEDVTEAELADLLKRAEKGDRSTLRQLRVVLRAEAEGRRHPSTLERYGSPPEWLRNSLANKVANKDDLSTKEATRYQLDRIERELAGPKPTALERLLAERAAFCWFLVNLYEALDTQASSQSFRQAEFNQRRIDAAHRRFLAAVRTLAQVRKLALPAFQVNIGTNQVNMA